MLGLELNYVGVVVEEWEMWVFEALELAQCPVINLEAEGDEAQRE